MRGNRDTRISRRTLLRTGGAAAIVLYGSAIPSGSAGPRFADYPFKLGVASGEPTPDGIVLWTRLAPDPLNGGGLGDASYRVRFEVAKDPKLPADRPPWPHARRAGGGPHGPRRGHWPENRSAGTGKGAGASVAVGVVTA